MILRKAFPNIGSAVGEVNDIVRELATSVVPAPRGWEEWLEDVAPSALEGGYSGQVTICKGAVRYQDGAYEVAFVRGKGGRAEATIIVGDSVDEERVAEIRATAVALGWDDITAGK